MPGSHLENSHAASSVGAVLKKLTSLTGVEMVERGKDGAKSGQLIWNVGRVNRLGYEVGAAVCRWTRAIAIGDDRILIRQEDFDGSRAVRIELANQ